MILSTVAVACLFLSTVAPSSALRPRNLDAKSGKLERDDADMGSKSGKTPAGKAGKSDGESDPDIDIYVDDVCEEFCNDYFYTYCPTSNTYLNPEAPANRRLEMTEEEGGVQPRVDNLPTVSEAMYECQRTCMSWPRGKEPRGDSKFGGDTIWCRRTHMELAGDSYYDAAFHCPHASNDSQGICVDSLVNGYTPYELLRDGESTRRHYGYCDLAGDDTIADCTAMFLGEWNLPQALKMMPATVEVIFLNDNNINGLEADVFKDNLKAPQNLQAIYINDNVLSYINEDALNGLSNLKIFNADNNNITFIPSDFLSENPKMLQFSMFNNLFSDIPSTLFSHTPDIERIVLYGNPNLGFFYPGTFDGLSKVEMFSFVNCAFNETGFPDGIFKDMTSLRFFDFFGNNFEAIEARWFEGGWGGNIRRLAFWGNYLLSDVEPEALVTLENLEVFYLHNTNITYLNDDVLKYNKNLNHLTVGITAS